jgi:hypothetical protein
LLEETAVLNVPFPRRAWRYLEADLADRANWQQEEPVDEVNSCVSPYGPPILVTRGQQQKSPVLFDHLVGANQECFWDCEPKRLCGLEIDDKLELGRLLDRYVGGLNAAQELGELRGLQLTSNSAETWASLLGRSRWF